MLAEARSTVRCTAMTFAPALIAAKHPGPSARAASVAVATPELVKPLGGELSGV